MKLSAVLVNWSRKPSSVSEEPRLRLIARLVAGDEAPYCHVESTHSGALSYFAIPKMD
jgi:hypothetical protein